jgi:antitoxin component HigA of HigAB toxin-antitoxin module
MSKHEEKVRGSTLNTDDLMSIDEHQEALEEAHYIHTINAFVELIVVYGYGKVIGDLRTAIGSKTW